MEINGYKLQDPPMSGGMALVYRGVKGDFNRAFKMVRPDKADDNAMLCQRFLQEIKLQSSLDHHNIIKVLDAYPYTDNGNIYTVLEMEWLNGKDLQKLVETDSPNGLDIDEVRKIALQVIEGMTYAHSKSVLHLDIKPSNIFRCDDGHVKIIDFGISKIIGQNADLVDGGETIATRTQTGESTFKGTLAYASPEQQVGGKLGFYSDIYSFGKTLHYICTGSTDPSVDVSDPQLQKIIEKCTQSNPKYRYQSFDEIRRDFDGEDTEVKCQHCGKSTSKASVYCPHCGTKIEKPEPPKPKKKQTCPKCGKERNEDEKFCTNCGHKFGDEPTKAVITGFRCSKCKKTTKAYTDGIVNFCNHCGASKESLTPVYKVTEPKENVVIDIDDENAPF